MKSSNDAILEAARGGDPDALNALLERHQGQVYRFGLAMCRDPEDARDVLQDTLLALARGVQDFRGASSLSTWLYTVARSACIKKRRVRKGAPERLQSLDVGGEALELADGAPGPDEQLASRRLERALAEAIGALAPPYREVLVLRDIEGLTAPEVAEVLGVSVQAVKSRLHRARLQVRSQLAPTLGADIAPSATCPDVLTLFSRHVEGDISAEVCAQMERHLEDCSRCRGACASLRRTLALCRTGPVAAVPPAVQASVRAALRDALSKKS